MLSCPSEGKPNYYQPSANTLPERITSMKTMLLAIAIVLLVFVPLTLAIQVDVQDYIKAVGLHLPGTAAQVTMEEGQTLTATIESVAFLAGKGMKGLKKGDAVEVTFLGKKEWKFVHVPSGQQTIKKMGTDFPANFLK
jgi:hypothetical protein